MRFAVLGVYVALAVHVVVGVLTVPLFAEAFGAERYGLWGALLGITSYLAPLNLGISQTVSSRISTTPGATPADLGRILRLGFTLYARSCIAGAAVVLPLALLVPWASVLNLSDASGAEARLAALCVAGSFLAELPFSVFRAALGGLGKLGVERGIGVVSLLLRLAAAYAFTLVPVPLWLAVLVISACNFVGHAACLLYLRRRQGIPVELSFLIPAADTSETPGFRKTGLWYLVIQLTAAVLWGTDPMLTGVLVDATAAARISVAWRAVALVMNVGTALGPAIGPHLARRWAEGSTELTARAGDIASRVVVGSITFGLLCFLGASDSIFHAWLGGSELVPERGVVLAYAAACIVWGWLIVPEAFIVQSGQHRSFAVCSAIEAVLKVVLSLVLWRYLGIAGVPLGTLAARMLTSMWFLPMQYSAAAGVPWQRYVALVAGASLLPGCAFVVAQWAARAGVLGGALGGALGDALAGEVPSTLVGAGVFVVAYVVFGVPREMRRWLISFFALRR